MHKGDNKRLLLIPLAASLLLCLTGCWSSNEIEELSVFVGVALDKGKELKVEKDLNKQGHGSAEKNLITSTVQIVNPQAAAPVSGHEGTAKQEKYTNLSEKGDSAFEMIRELSLRTDRPLIGHHLKVVVIGEELARAQSLEKLLDFFIRDNDIRPSCIALISTGLARDTLESKGAAEIPSFRLFGMIDNQYRTTRILPPMSFARLQGKMQSGSSFLVQNVTSTDKEVKFAGAAIIQGKTKKLLGFLNEEELEGITWITGKGKGGLVKSYDEKTGQLITYEILGMTSRITPHIEGNDISFHVNIESDGRLMESSLDSGNPFKEEFLKKAEKISEAQVKQLMNHVLKKMQGEYQVDVAGFGNRLRIDHPKVWKQVKDNWDQTFSEAPVTIDVKLSIKEFGASGGFIKR
uniref:Ger(x)C family spore germination protein n=1 Tax=Paenibacillus foliorum TaxID=2654974 RepID=UPI0028A95A1D|nr:Ger(x)C family spore germination protein [Paenibacillus foliorum]